MNDNTLNYAMQAAQPKLTEELHAYIDSLVALKYAMEAVDARSTTLLYEDLKTLQKGARIAKRDFYRIKAAFIAAAPNTNKQPELLAMLDYTLTQFGKLVLGDLASEGDVANIYLTTAQPIIKALIILFCTYDDGVSHVVVYSAIKSRQSDIEKHGIDILQIDEQLKALLHAEASYIPNH